VTTTLRSFDELRAAGLATEVGAAELDAVLARYAVAITPTIAHLIDRDDDRDPIARQFVPTARELIATADERADPIGDARHSPVAGIVHRHDDRVLLKAVSACPVYCRFCFRREWVGTGDALSAEALEAALGYIAEHREIWEVILTGGDPFVMSPRRVRDLSSRIAGLGHVKVLRWHTRVPFVDPARITPEFVSALKAGGAATWVALHANHPREFSKAARAAIGRLGDAGLPLVSQSVLLRGVNNDVDTLAQLMRAFVELRVKPYYLHHPDLAPGTSHFRIAIDEGLALMKALRRRLSGLALPTYVLDIPGGAGKVPLESTDVEKVDNGSWRIRDASGRWHSYPPQ
jgi:lysine 2,3-aminomutase